jgi:hypothetical protein
MADAIGIAYYGYLQEKGNQDEWPRIVWEDCWK